MEPTAGSVRCAPASGSRLIPGVRFSRRSALLYKQDKALFDLLVEESRANRQAVEKDYGCALNAIVKTLEAQFALADQIVWSLGQHHFSLHRETEAAIFSSFHKNVFLFYSCIELARMGPYGPANTLLRPIFEGLVIGKFCSVSSSISTFEKWARGEYVHLTNEVLNKVRWPSVTELKTLWKILNQLAHATTYAQQASIAYKDIKGDVGVTLSLVQVLLDCNHHLLSRHLLTPSTARYTKIYGNAERFVQSRNVARTLALEAHRTFTKSSKSLIREYLAS